MTYEEYKDACFEFIKNKEDLDEQEKHFALAPLQIDRDDLALHGGFIFKRLELMGYEVVKKQPERDVVSLGVYTQLEKEALALAKEKGGEDYEKFILAVNITPEMSKRYAAMFFDFIVAHSKELNVREEV